MGTCTTIYANVTLSFISKNFHSRPWDDAVDGQGGRQDEIENVSQITKNHPGRGTLPTNCKNHRWFQDVMLRLQARCHPVRFGMRGEFRGVVSSIPSNLASATTPIQYAYRRSLTGCGTDHHDGALTS